MSDRVSPLEQESNFIGREELFFFFSFFSVADSDH